MAVMKLNREDLERMTWSEIVGALLSECEKMDKEDRELRRNASGCFDPTAYIAIKHVDKTDEKFHKLLDTIFYICDQAGFDIKNRIVLEDKKTGKIYR